MQNRPKLPYTDLDKLWYVGRHIFEAPCLIVHLAAIPPGGAGGGVKVEDLENTSTSITL